MSTQQYDRSGRLGIEEFIVRPQGRDPLKRYFEGGFMGGGLSSGPKLLASEPELLQRELNEWAAIDSPGHYSVQVSSHRVSLFDGSPRPRNIELKSNTVEFDVVEADPAWQQQALSSTVQILDSADSTPEEKRKALRVLRFLDSPGAVRELVRRATRTDARVDFDVTAGLAASRDVRAVVEEIERRIQEPDAAVTGDLLNLWTKLAFQLKRDSLPPYPQDDKEQQANWMKAREAYDLQYWDTAFACELKASETIAAKQGAARAVTIQTLMFRPYTKAKPLPAITAVEMASVFLSLPLDQQSSLLGWGWEKLKTDAMVPVLRKVLEQPDLTSQDLRSLALRRLFELDPAEGTTQIRREIAAPHIDNKFHIVSFNSLTLLPNKHLPDMELMLVHRLADPNNRTRELDARLIARYGTAQTLPLVKAEYEKGGFGCESQDALLDYFLRMDLEYGLVRLKEAPVSYCLNDSLATLVQLKRWKDYEPVLAQQLLDKDSNRARTAAEKLGRYGGESAKKILFQRMKAFSAAWNERAAEFNLTPKTAPDVSQAISFQYGLTNALGTASGFVLSNDEISELEELTLGQHRENVARWHWSSPVSLHVTYIEADRIAIRIGDRYESQSAGEASKKLSQFPPGTAFQLTGMIDPRLEHHVTRLKQAAGDAKVSLADARQ